MPAAKFEKYNPADHPADHDGGCVNCGVVNRGRTPMFQRKEGKNTVAYCAACKQRLESE